MAPLSLSLITTRNWRLGDTPLTLRGCPRTVFSWAHPPSDKKAEFRDSGVLGDPPLK